MGNLFNIKDARFGKLVVKDRLENQKNGNARWLCVCDCGNKRICRGRLLKKGIITCCTKCSNSYEDFTGRKIGKLQIIRRGEDEINCDGHPVIKWECECECGEKVTRTSNHLRQGNCFCLKCKKQYDRKNNFRGCGEMSGIQWSSIKRHASQRNKEFLITKEYVWNLFLQQRKKCALSGIELIFAKDKHDHLTGGTTASLDRMDSSKGYVEGNVQWVHKWINVMKSDFSTEEFLQYCRRIVNYNDEQQKVTACI